MTVRLAVSILATLCFIGVRAQEIEELKDPMYNTGLDLFHFPGSKPFSENDERGRRTVIGPSKQTIMSGQKKLIALDIQIGEKLGREKVYWRLFMAPPPEEQSIKDLEADVLKRIEKVMVYLPQVSPSRVKPCPLDKRVCAIRDPKGRCVRWDCAVQEKP